MSSTCLLQSITLGPRRTTNSLSPNPKHFNLRIESNDSFSLLRAAARARRPRARPRCAGSAAAGPGGDDPRPLEALFLRLYTAMKERRVEELSELVGAEEHGGLLDLLPIIGMIKGKKRALEALSMLVRLTGDRLAIVIKPNERGGADVGLEWNLEWHKTHKPPGRDYSFYTFHLYKGKMSINNANALLEQLFDFEPLQWKYIGLLAPIIDRITSSTPPGQGKKRILLVCLGFMILIAIFSLAL